MHASEHMKTHPSLHKPARIQAAQHLSFREALLLASYHLRLLNWWLFLLMFLGFLGACILFWYELHIASKWDATQSSVFVLEAGAGLIACILTSSLIIGDPLLELIIATREGIGKVLAWRYLLTFFLLLLCSSAYLLWCLSNGVSYVQHQSWLFLLLLWLSPVLLMSMLSLLSTLATRSATLGTVIALLPLMVTLFLHETLLTLPATHPFFIPYSYWERNAPDWLSNRLTLLGIAIALAVWNWLWVQHEERLLGRQQ